MLVLSGIAVMIAGLATGLNPPLVAAMAGVATGLAAGFALPR